MSAFQLPVKQNDTNENDQLITVLDTPGHAAFSEMRRVCQSASDLVVLCIDINQVSYSYLALVLVASIYFHCFIICRFEGCSRSDCRNSKVFKRKQLSIHRCPH